MAPGLEPEVFSHPAGRAPAAKEANFGRGAAAAAAAAPPADAHSRRPLFAQHQPRRSGGGDEAAEERHTDRRGSFEFLSSAFVMRRPPRPQPRLSTWQGACDPLVNVRDTEPSELMYRAAVAVFPCLQWCGKYDRQLFKADLVAGVTVAIMLIPQSMAYAMIAGLPSEYGLYASLVPLYVYALLGSSRQLAVGPVALASLLVEAGVSDLVDSSIEPEKYIKYAVTLAFLVGLIQLAMGITQSGWVVSFLSHSILSGFTSAAAITIGLSQLKHIVGYKIEKSHSIIPTLSDAINGASEIHGLTVAMGLSAIACLLVMKHLGKTYKKLRFLRVTGPLVVTVAGLIISYAADIESHGVKIVGTIPEGLPKPDFDLEYGEITDLLPSGIIIAFVSFLESIAIAKSLAARNKYEIAANNELVGLGMANLLGSFFKSYPTTGSFSRSAVNNETGAKTPFAAVITATCVMIGLLLVTSVLHYLPKNVLAAIVISAVSGLVDTDEVRFLWRVSRKDLVLWMTAFLMTLLAGIEVGIASAVTLSLVFVIYETARPHTALLGRLPNTSVYRNVLQYADAQKLDGIVVLRIDAPIYFANVDYIKDQLRKYELQAVEEVKAVEVNGSSDQLLSGQVRYVIVEMSPVSSVDSTGLHALRTIISEYRERRIQFALANPNPVVMDTLEQAAIPSLLGREWIFLRVHDAVMACQADMDAPCADGGPRAGCADLEAPAPVTKAVHRAGAHQDATRLSRPHPPPARGNVM